MPNIIDLFEYVTSDRSVQVCEEQGVVKNVRVLGLKSANDRTYSREAVKKAVGLYEGKVVNANHSTRAGDRSVYDRVGWLENVRQESDGGLRADLHYLKAHSLAAPLVEAARRNPCLFGLSHTARGNQVYKGGENVIESIDSVSSVDLVAEPATVSGLHESRNTPVKLTVKALCEQLKAKRPKYASLITEMAESGILSPGAMMDAPPAAAEAPPEAVDHVQALRDAAKAVLDDTTLDMKSMVQKIKKILKIIGGDQGGDPPPMDDSSSDDGADDSGDTSDDEKKKEESKRHVTQAQLQEELDRLRARDRLRDACDEAGVKVTRALLEAVNPKITEAQAKALAAGLRGTAAGASSHGQRPKSAPPGAAKNGDDTAAVTESKAPDDRKDVIAWLKS